MKPYFRNEKGFTLIEVIVVAVIIAVLSAVAIPLYNGYIKDSRKRTAENVAGSCASFIGTAYSTLGDHFATRCKVQLSEGGAHGSIDSSGTVWYSSSNAVSARFIIENDTNATMIDNYFIIPTDISVQLSGNVVRARHALDSTRTVTQDYRYRAQ